MPPRDPLDSTPELEPEGSPLEGAVAGVTPRTQPKSPRAAYTGVTGSGNAAVLNPLPGAPMNFQRRAIETEDPVLEIQQRRRRVRAGLWAAGARRAAALAFAGALILPLAAEAGDVMRSTGRSGGIVEGTSANQPATHSTSSSNPSPPASAPTASAPTASAPTAAAPPPTAGPTAPPAQAAFSKGELWSGVGSWILRPTPKFYDSTCGMTDLSGRVLSPDGRELGTSHMIFMRGESFVATTETKGDHAKANSGDDLVFSRSYTSTGPGACQGSGPCNTLMSNLSAMTTCYNASKANGIRGLNRGDNLATEAATYNGYATTWRGASAPKPVIILSVRWDLLTPAEMQVAGFQPSFLLEAAPGAYDAFQTWLTSDTSYYCGAGSDCEWSDSYNGWNQGYRDRDLGFRFKDQINYFGSANDYKKYIYYLTRPNSAKPLNANGVLTDMSDDAYLAWRIARVKAILAEINQPNVIVLLSQKLGLRYSGPNGARNGSLNFAANERCRTVTDFLWASRKGVYHPTAGIDHAATSPYQSDCSIPYTQGGAGNVEGRAVAEGGFSSDTYAAGETYEKYVLSLKNVADELTKAGVPYAWETAGGEWGREGYFNNTATPTNEDAVLREITLGASFVWITGTTNQEDLDAVEAAVKGKIPYVRGE